MILSGVDFPAELLEAAQNNKLVVFAGAGVSMGPPANLPSFWSLALAIARGTGKTPMKLGTDVDGKDIYEPLDTFLGQVLADEEAIQACAVKELSIKESAHTQLHLSLLELFESPENVRLITTNFDQLFSSAANQLWGRLPDVYTAPALPLGSSFHGIVHIHGALDKQSSIVITDRGLGMAYLTQGWARRFLVDLFNHYSVLFVGYSHEDVVLKYLARALPVKSGGQRYAMIGQGENETRWQLLGITPITFPKKDAGDYSSLYSGIDKLAQFRHRPPSGWRDEVGRIVANGSLLNVEDRGVIEHALLELSKVRFFTAQAQSPDWAIWLQQNGYLSQLFASDKPCEISQELGRWLLNRFVVVEPDLIFLLVSMNHGKLGSWFWFELARHVHVTVDVPNIQRWLDFLLDLSPVNPDEHALHWLAQTSANEGLCDVTLRIWELMAKPRLQLTEPYSSYNGQQGNYLASVKIRSNVAEWSLNEVWKKWLKPNLSQNYRALLLVCTKWLLLRSQIANNWQLGTAAWDIDSMHRLSIAEDPQEKYNMESSDVIIDAARDALLTYSEKMPELLLQWSNEHINSSSIILKRLAVYGVQSHPSLTSTQKLEWLLSVGLTNDVYRPEAIALHQQSYFEASETIRASSVEHIMSHVTDDTPAEDAEYKWHWLQLLKSDGKECRYLQEALDSLALEYPEMAIEVAASSPAKSGWIGSRWTLAELISQSSEEWFNKVATSVEEHKHGFSIAADLQQITAAASENEKWRTSFIEYLLAKNTSHLKVWEALLTSYNNWPEDENAAEALLSLTENVELQKYHPRAVAKVLLALVEKPAMPYLHLMLQRTNAVASNLWENNECSAPPFKSSQEDWFTMAINTLEGDIARYWINALDKFIKNNNRQLIAPYRVVLTTLCDIKYEKSKYSIPIIASNSSFLAGLDEQWFKEFLAPKFDPENELSVKAWHGLLGYGRLSVISFTALEPHFFAMVPHVQRLLKGWERKFYSYYLGPAFWDATVPTVDWLPHLIQCTDEENRVEIAAEMGSILRKIRPDTIEAVWDGWLQSYWLDRIDGKPASLSAGEAGEAVQWLLQLSCKFADAVNVAIKMPSPDLKRSWILQELGDVDYKHYQLNDLARLLCYLLTGDLEQGLYGLDDVTSKIQEGPIEPGIRRRLNEALISLGQSPLKE